MCKSIIWVEVDSELSFPFAILPLPPCDVYARNSQMRFGKIVIQAQRLLRGGFGLRHVHFRVGRASASENIVFLRKLGISECVIWVCGYCLFIITYRPFEIVRAGFAKGVAPFEQQFEGL